MKLRQITQLSENSGNVQTFLQAFPDITNHAINDDNTIDVYGDGIIEFDRWDSTWPKLNHVEFDEMIFVVNSANDMRYLPATVSGSCTIDKKFVDPIKSSMLPECITVGNSSTEIAFNSSMSHSSVILDDETMSSYANWGHSIVIIEGYNFIPERPVRSWGEVAVRINNWATWPSNQQFDVLNFIVETSDLMHRIDTKVKLQVKRRCMFTIPDPSPVLGILKVVPETTEVKFKLTNSPLKAASQLAYIFNQRGSKDIFEIQEELIDAGLNRFAKR